VLGEVPTRPLRGPVLSVEEDEEDEEDEDEEDFSKRVGAARLFSLRRLLPLPAMFCAPSESWRLEWEGGGGGGVRDYKRSFAIRNDKGR